jgi:septal ring-binding cell division protein DamX
MKIALWILGALAGVVLAAGVTYAASSLSTQRIGLSSEPVNAGRELAPRATATRTPTPTPTPKPKKKKRRPKPTATARPTATAVPTAVPTVDDHGGGGGDDSGGGGSSGRGLDHPEDD